MMGLQVDSVLTNISFRIAYIRIQAGSGRRWKSSDLMGMYPIYLLSLYLAVRLICFLQKDASTSLVSGGGMLFGTPVSL
jgi:hypothetical protein